MIRAVLVVSVAPGAESELKVRIIKFCPSTDGTFMSCDILRSLHALFVDPPSVYLPWREPFKVFICNVKDQEVGHSHNDGYREIPVSVHKSHHNIVQHDSALDHTQILDLDRYHEHDKHLKIRIQDAKCQKHGLVHIVKSKVSTR